MSGVKEEGWSWLVVAAAFLIQLLTVGLTYSSGLLQLEVMREMGLGAVEATWLPAVLLLTSTASGLPGKALVRRLGARLTVMLGGLMASAGLGGAYFATSLLHLLLLVGCLTGVGLGLCYVPSLVALEQHFHANRKFAHGFAVSGIGLGQVFIGLLFPWLVHQFTWRGALLMMGGCCLHLVLAGVALWPPTPAPKTADKLATTLPLGLCCSVKPWPSRRLIDVVCLAVASLLWGGGTSALCVLTPAYAQDEGTVHLADLGLLIVFIGMANFVSRLLFSIVGHGSKIDIFVSFFCTVALTAILCFLQPDFFPDFTGQVTFCLILGFSVGYWSTLTQHFTREHVGNSLAAAAAGWVMLATSVGVACGPMAVAYIAQARSFTDAFYFACGVMLVASLIICINKTVPAADDDDKDPDLLTMTPLNPDVERLILYRETLASV